MSGNTHYWAVGSACLCLRALARVPDISALERVESRKTIPSLSAAIVLRIRVLLRIAALGGGGSDCGARLRRARSVGDDRGLDPGVQSRPCLNGLHHKDPKGRARANAGVREL